MTVDFQVFPTMTVAKEGGMEYLQCKVTGVPIPQIAWKKDGELITNASRFAITTDISIKNNSVSSQLLIRDVSKEDVGFYYCISWNRGSVRVTKTTLLLTGKYHKLVKIY